MQKFSDIFSKKRSGTGCRRRRFPGRWVLTVAAVAASAGLLFCSGSPAAASKGADRFEAVIKTLSAFGDRSLGSDGSQQTAAYIKEAFEQIGIEEIGSQRFSVPGPVRTFRSTSEVTVGSPDAR